MECSTEMKVQMLDEVIDERKKLISLQDSAGIYTGVGEDEKILIYSTEDFIEIAKYVQEKVFVGKKNSYGNYEVHFIYKGVGFQTFILPAEYERYKEEIAEGDTNV